jgi:YVTN family beta-propeller protein
VGISAKGSSLRPLPIRTHHQRRRRKTRLLGIGFIVVVIGAGVYLIVRPSSSPKAATSTNTHAAPPSLVGVVTEIGAGAVLGNGNSAEVIDLQHATSKGERSVTVGTFPDAVAISIPRETAYVTNYTDGTVTPVDLLTGRPGKPIHVGGGPAGIAITPDNKMAYVTDAGSAPLGDTVTPIDLKTHRVLRAIKVGLGPQGIAITPDGKTAYVANAGAIVTGQTGAIGHTVTPINLVTKRALTAINVGNAPIAIAISGDGSTAFVTNSYSGSVSPISVAANVAGTPIEMVGSPQAIVNIPKKNQMLIANAATTGADNLTTIAVATESAGASITVPSNPTSLAITPDGKTAWVVSNGTKALVSVDLASGVVDTAHALTFAGGPYAIAIGTIPSTSATKLFAPVTKVKSKTKG